MRQLLKLCARAGASGFKMLPRPYKLTFVATYKCNSRCRLCNIWSRKEENELSIDEIDAFFRKNPYFSWIDVTGGEVSLHPHIDEVFRSAIMHSPGLYLLHFPTNGLLPKRIIGVAQNIMKQRLPKLIISISLDGPRELHDELRGIKNNWLKAIETYKGLSKMRSGRFECYFGMTLSNYNLKTIKATLEDIKKEISDFRPEQLHINIAHSSEVYYQNKESSGSFTISAEDYRKFVLPILLERKASFSSVHILERLYQRKIMSYLSNKKTPVSCRSSEVSCFVDSKGNVFPCGFFNLALGNLRDTKFELDPILKSDKNKKALNLIKAQKCPNCWTPCEAYQTILGNIFNPSLYL